MRRLSYYLKKKSLWVFIILLAIVIKLSIGYFSDSIKLYTVQQSKEYTSKIVEEILQEDLLSIMEEGSMMQSVLDNEGSIVYSYVDTYKVNRIKALANSKMVNAIETIELQEEFQMVELPLGYFFSKNIFLSNGIKVPINIDVIGSHDVDILVKAETKGINTSIVEIYLSVNVEVQVTIPFQAEAISCQSLIPLSIEIINGDVPQYYYNGITPIISSK